MFLSINILFSIVTRPNHLVEKSLNNSFQQNSAQKITYNSSHIELVRHYFENNEIEDEVEENEKAQVLKFKVNY
jgi:hypothetical protein